jgi:ATP-dependent Clp protease ATP-binding subunit ClpX
LTQEDLVRILVEPKNALTRQYQKLLELDNVELEIQEDALQEIAQKALDRQIGARGLRSIMEGVMTKIMYAIPSDLSIKKVIITKDAIHGGEPKILRDRKNPRPQAGMKN